MESINGLSESEIISLAKQMIGVRKYLSERHNKCVRESSQCLLRLLDIYDEYGEDKRAAELSIEFKDCNERRRELTSMINLLDEINSII